MTADGFGDVDDGLDAAVCGPEIPSFEEEFGHVGGLGIEILEHQADLVSPGGFQMTASEVEGLQFCFSAETKQGTIAGMNRMCREPKSFTRSIWLNCERKG